MRAFLFAVLLLALAPGAGIRTDAAQAGTDGPMTGDAKMDYKLRTGRAERAFEELRKAGEDIDRLAADVAARVDRKGGVDDDARKDIEKICKLAKRVRSEYGVGGTPKLDDPPAAPRDAAAALRARAEALGEAIESASRFEVNAKAVTLAGEILALGEVLIKLGR